MLGTVYHRIISCHMSHISFPRSAQDPDAARVAARNAVRPRGKVHGASIAAGMARQQVRKAAADIKATTLSVAQDISRVIFGPWGRGQNSSGTRKVFLRSK